MSNLDMWSLILGTITPPLISILQQPPWSKPLRALVTLLVCCAIGFGNVWFHGDLSGTPLVTSILVVLVATLATFRNFWRPLGVTGAIESATSPTAPPQPITSSPEASGEAPTV